MKEMPGTGLGVMILNDNGEVLLILRNNDPIKADSKMRLEGLWTLPAGKVKYGETLESAAQRKVKEETNLETFNFELVSVADDINMYAHFVTIGFVAHNWSGEIKLGDTEEHVAHKFYDLDALPLNLCEPSKQIIMNYRNNRIYKRKED